MVTVTCQQLSMVNGYGKICCKTVVGLKLTYKQFNSLTLKNDRCNDDLFNTFLCLRDDIVGMLIRKSPKELIK